jgi:KipI family sensor histidine kinase inhibitor
MTLDPTPIGDAALEIMATPGSAIDMVARVRTIADAIAAAAVPGVSDVVPAVDRVLIIYDPTAIGTLADLQQRLRMLSTASAHAPRTTTRHEIPVCYGGPYGPDLDSVCRLHGLDRDTLARLHTAADYLVQAVGFTPGFAYLHGLPDSLHTPRRATPRSHVAAGAVGIGGSQTGVYPFATPGGWNIIGHTSVRLFDLPRQPSALLRAGDTVRFHAIDAADLESLGPASPDLPPPAAATVGLVVEDPGLHATIQDLGRPGQRASGVPLSGACDQDALRLANLLVGNPEMAAGIEFTLVGPRLRFERDAIIAVAGGDFTGMPRLSAVRISAGTRLALGQARSGCRGVLAIAGGIDLPTVLGSVSTYEPAGLGGLGGRRLAAGDRLPVGQRHDGRMPNLADMAGVMSMAADPPRPCTLRIIPAPDAGDCGADLWQQSFRASSRSDRMGLRLEVTAAVSPAAGDHGRSLSRPVLPGTVQLPPDGQPIVLLADAQTMGGYPVIGHVITADLRLAAQLRPGHPVRWQRCTLDEAHAAARAVAASWATLRQAVGPGGGASVS